MNKNILITIDLEDLFDWLEEKFNDELKADEIIKSLKKNEKFLIGFNCHLIFKNSDLEYLKDLVGLDIIEDIEIETLYNCIQIYEEGSEFGIREYDCFHFNYDEVHDRLEDYFNSEKYTEEIFKGIKEKELEGFLKEKYYNQVAIMIKERIKQIEEMAKNKSIERW